MGTRDRMPTSFEPPLWWNSPPESFRYALSCLLSVAAALCGPDALSDSPVAPRRRPGNDERVQGSRAAGPPRESGPG
jgi:hypothetical protein